MDALLLALQTTVDREVQPVAGTFQLRFGGDHVSLTVRDGEVTAVRRLVEDPVAVIDTDPGTLRSLVFGGEPLREAVAAGSVRIDGDEGAVGHLMSMFKRPSSTA